MIEEVRSAASFEGLIVLAVIYFVLSMLSKAGKKAGRQRPVPPPQPHDPATTATQEEGFSLEAVLREIERVKREAERRQTPPAQDPERPRMVNPPVHSRPEGQRPRHLEAAERQRAEGQRPRHIEALERARPEGERPRHIEQLGRPKSEGKRPRALPSTERRGRMAKVLDEMGPLGRHSPTRLPSAEEMEERDSLEGQSLEVEGQLEVLDETRRRPRVEVDQDEGAEAVIQRRLQEAEARNREFSETDHRKFHQKLNQSSTKAATPRGLTTAQLRQAFVWREILGPPKGLE
jgi:hypothetical protein